MTSWGSGCWREQWCNWGGASLLFFTAFTFPGSEESQIPIYCWVNGEICWKILCTRCALNSGPTVLVMSVLTTRPQCLSGHWALNLPLNGGSHRTTRHWLLVSLPIPLSILVDSFHKGHLSFLFLRNKPPVLGTLNKTADCAWSIYSSKTWNNLDNAVTSADFRTFKQLMYLVFRRFSYAYMTSDAWPDRPSFCFLIMNLYLCYFLRRGSFCKQGFALIMSST